MGNCDVKMCWSLVLSDWGSDHVAPVAIVDTNQ